MIDLPPEFAIILFFMNKLNKMVCFCKFYERLFGTEKGINARISTKEGVIARKVVAD
jgi:hypothetical protein